jgi:hypothetical protein
MMILLTIQALFKPRFVVCAPKLANGKKLKKGFALFLLLLGVFVLSF